MTWTIYISFHLPFLMMLHIKFGFDWPSGLEKKIFKYYGHIHVYSPGVGADNPLRTFFSININLLSICIFPASFPPFHYILLTFPIQMHGHPMLALHKIGQGHPKVMIYKIGQGHPKVMIYINFVELLSLMLHAKAFWFWRRRFFAIYSHGGHLGYVTLTIYTTFILPS